MKKILFILTICLLCSISAFSQSKKKWEKAQSLNSIAAYEDFIMKYPSGEYTELAKQELEKLKEIQNQEIERLKILKNQMVEEANQVLQKIVPGIQMEEVLKIIGYDNLINREIGIKKGAYIGEYDIFPQDANKESDFSGTAEMKGYVIAFKKGKVVSSKIDQEKLGTKGCKFSNEDGIHTIYCNPEFLMQLPDLK